METLLNLGAILVAYLLGSLSSAIIVCRLAGLPDPRQQGSGNPGATNVLRFGGKKLAAIVLLGDLLKGLIPALIAQALGLADEITAAVGLAAFAGHIYPVFFGFRGGKGVATAVGIIFALSWLTGLVLIMIWLLISRLFHISSLAAICAALAAPLTIGIIHPLPAYLVTVSIMSLMLIWRHRSNIRNLLKGEEPRIGRKKTSDG
jgi:glycerol-3-phosphate acyltransferase PlsY